MANVTTDALVKAIATARNKDNVVVAVANATGGKAISDAIMTKVHDALAAKITGDKAEQTIGSIMSILKASEGLPNIRAKAKELFANDAVRKGSEFTAVRAGIAAWNTGKRDNELVAAMSEKCPLMSSEEKALAQLKSLLSQVKDKCSKAGKAELESVVDSLIVKVG